ncbi:MAG: hypothetical protein P4L16_00590 [Chlamydiales bacterium]|nr:hypothetical protein [Chlamydiales bacterium]
MRILSFLFLAVSSFVGAYVDRCVMPDRLFLGPEYQFRAYSFPITATAAGSQNMWGGFGGYEHLCPQDLFIRLFSRLNSGKERDSFSDTFDHEWTVEGNIGYTLAFGRFCNWLITPYTGFGYLQDRQTNYGDTTLHAYKNYIPVGLLLGWDVNRDWSLFLRGQVNFEVLRVQISDDTGTITKKPNWLIELPVIYRFLCHWDVSLVPEYMYAPDASMFDDSGDWGGIHTYGLRLELGYCW